MLIMYSRATPLLPLCDTICYTLVQMNRRSSLFMGSVRMPDKQLNVWIPEELRNYVAQRAEQERHGMNTVIADLIREDMARRNGQLAEQSSLVVFREIVASELQKSSAQLRRDLREDREYEAESQFEWFKKQFDRLAGLMVMAVRNGGIARRLTYSMLSKTHGANFAKAAYEDAREKARQELLPKKAASANVPVDDDEQMS